MKKKRILITGGSGLIGRHLTKLLLQDGNEVAWLSRSHRSDTVRIFHWDVESQSIDKHSLEWADVIIHLAGEGVANRRWTNRQKTAILETRIKSTQLLVDKLKESKTKISHFICASAIGYYGIEVGNEKNEESSIGKDFLAKVTEQWEQTADQIADIGIFLTKLRIGIVLSRHGGALTKMSSPIKWGIGAALGTGKQYLSWIHIDDLCTMFSEVIAHKKLGVYNATAPNPVTNSQMTKAIAHQLRRPLFLPNVPGFVLRIMFGEIAEVLLGGSKVLPTKFLKEGFNFQYPRIGDALKDTSINSISVL